jgi:hypothetical protein
LPAIVVTAVTLVLVIVPASFIGAALPILTQYFSRRLMNIGRSVGLLYSINTLGSAVACLVGASQAVSPTDDHPIFEARTALSQKQKPKLLFVRGRPTWQQARAPGNPETVSRALSSDANTIPARAPLNQSDDVPANDLLSGWLRGCK